MTASAERSAELLKSLTEVRARIQKVINPSRQAPLLVAVSKLKPPADVLAAFQHGQRDFGENYAQELHEKAQQLPSDIRWHFIGTLQSNKVKTLASIPNLSAVQTLTSLKTATLLDKAILPDRPTPLDVFLQVNTSGEHSKSGLGPLTPTLASTGAAANSELVSLAKHVITQCPRLRLQGLMTIGSFEASLLGSGEQNQDFERLKETKDVLQQILFDGGDERSKWGLEGRLLLSMGMSHDFEVAIKAGSDVVRVGTSVFGERPKQREDTTSTASNT